MRSYYSSDVRARNAPVKVLLVDDDENSFVLTRRLLSKLPNKFEIDWVPTYEEGLEAVSKQAHDVYLFDYRLGTRNGLELLKEALAIGCKNPIIMLTTENPEVDAEAMRLGAADFLSKDHLDTPLLERSIRYSIKHYATLQALRESEAQLASFMQNVPCAVYMKDLQGRYVYVNEECEKVFNRAFADWVGRSDDELWPKSLAQKFKQNDQRVISEKRVLQSTETLEQPDGLHYWLTSKFPILNEQGTPIMLGGAAIDITDQKRLEEQIQEVSEKEKRRIGQDLHDGLGQYLTGIAFMAKVLEQKLADKKLPEAAEAEKITTLVNRTIFQARDLARGLCPVELEKNGLQSALQELSSSVQKLFNIRCTLQCPQPVFIHDNAVAVHLYRIAQEAISNAIKHGKATNVVVRLTVANGMINLSVKDDGCGIPKAGARGKGMGLQVMQYRAGMIGATIKIENNPGGGTKVTCTFPYNRVEAKDEEPLTPTKAIGPGLSRGQVATAIGGRRSVSRSGG